MGFISKPGPEDWRATADRQALALRDARRQIDALFEEIAILKRKLEFGSCGESPQVTPHPESVPGRKFKKFGKSMESVE